MKEGRDRDDSRVNGEGWKGVGKGGEGRERQTIETGEADIVLNAGVG